MHQGHGQSAPAVLARRGLLADVGLGESMPNRSMWRVAQFDTLRLRFVKIAARVIEMKRVIRMRLPTSCPGREVLLSPVRESCASSRAPRSA
jgi:Transposase DDE domain group 1